MFSKEGFDYLGEHCFTTVWWKEGGGGGWLLSLVISHWRKGVYIGSGAVKIVITNLKV